MGREDSPLRDRVVFVEGASRDETTSLVTLLAAHPDVEGAGSESHLFDFGVDRLFDNFEHRDPYRHGLRRYIDRDELVDLVRDVCDGVLLAMRSGLSSSYVVESTPTGEGSGDTLDLERRRECYPDAWYIHLSGDRRARVSDLPRRYREVSYEQLRADPRAGCQALFDWLGIDAGEQTLGQLPRLPPSAGVEGSRPTLRRLVMGARAAAARGRERVAHDTVPPPGSGVAFLMVRALFDRDADALRSLTAPSFEFVYRSPDGNRSLRGDDGRAALAQIAEDAFTRRYVSEWWGAPGAGPSEWWTSVPGAPFSSIFFSGLGGDASRMDVALGLVLEEDLVRRAVVFSAGSLSGRPVLASK